MTSGQGYIDGIYNYCDRWCERCPLTARCRVFASDRELRRLDGENAAFWKMFETLTESQSHEWLEEFLPDVEDEPEEESYLPELDDWDEEDEDDFNSLADRHPLVKLASEYGMDVSRWLEQVDGGERSGSVSGEGATSLDSAAVRREDALDVVSWYCLQIGIKLQRAMRGAEDSDKEQLWDDEENEVEDGVEMTLSADDIRRILKETAQMERDGSAKVSLIGIERSLGAWTILRDHFPEHEPTIREHQRTLARLRRMLDEQIPGARTFERPGFEYEV